MVLTWFRKDRFKLKLNAYNYPYWSVFVLYAKLHMGSSISACQLFSSMFGVCFLIQKLSCCCDSFGFASHVKDTLRFFVILWNLEGFLTWKASYVVIEASFFLFRVKEESSQETSDMDWDIKARKCKSFDFRQNMHDLAFIIKNKKDINFFAQICWTLFCLPPWFSTFRITVLFLPTPGLTWSSQAHVE